MYFTLTAVLKMNIRIFVFLGLFFCFALSRRLILTNHRTSKILNLSIQLSMLVPTQMAIAAFIPDVSSVDSRTFNDIQVLAPNNDIATLDGALNLGGMLWGFVLYCGLFTTAGRPAEWILPIIAKLFSKDTEKWYIDAKDG